MFAQIFTVFAHLHIIVVSSCGFPSLTSRSTSPATASNNASASTPTPTPTVAKAQQMLLRCCTSPVSAILNEAREQEWISRSHSLVHKARSLASLAHRLYSAATAPNNASALCPTVANAQQVLLIACTSPPPTILSCSPATASNNPSACVLLL